MESGFITEHHFRSTVEQVPVGITILRGPEFIVEMANETYLQIVDRKEEDFVGKPLFEVLPEVQEYVQDLLTGVLNTGVPYQGYEFPVTINRYDKKELAYFNFIYKSLREKDGRVTGIIVVANDVTELVNAREKLAESERQFRSLVMQSPIAMTIFRGPDLIIEMANTVLIEKIWRKKAADVIGKELLEAFPELRQQKYPELLNKVYTTGIAHNEKESVAYVEGEDGLRKFYLDYEYSPLRGPDGLIRGIMVTANDVTENVTAWQKVEVINERLSLAAKASGIANWDMDLLTNEVDYSPRMLEIFGHQEGALSSHAELRAQVHPDDRYIVEEAYADAPATGVYTYEVRIIRPDGSIGWIKTQGSVLYDENNRPVKIIGALRDITEEKKFAQELERQVQERTKELEGKNRELEKKNTELDSFAYVSSHDLQEPLRKIQAFISRIEETEGGHFSEKTKTYFSRIHSAASRMQALIKDLLNYSRTGSSERIFFDTSVSELLEDVKNDLKEAIEEKKALIDAIHLGTAYIIPFQFRQLLTNIISNSLKFSKKGQVPHIRLSAEIKNGAEYPVPGLQAETPYYHLSISDNGIGFHPQYSDRIFEVFQRLQGREESEGTGIGLSIVKKIIENHKGIITATGQENIGATFDIYIPAQDSLLPVL